MSNTFKQRWNDNIAYWVGCVLTFGGLYILRAALTIAISEANRRYDYDKKNQKI